jgi:hypothetical protein
VIVDDFYAMSIAVTPNEADSESVVDSNAVLSTAVAFESLQPVAREDGQVLQSMGSVQLPQFPLCYPRDCLESPRHASGQ